jgi:predicted neutral ceramidase superfamily lipid hydrolase
MYTKEEMMVSVILGAIVTVGMMFCYGGFVAKQIVYKILFWLIACLLCLLWIAVLIRIISLL